MKKTTRTILKRIFAVTLCVSLCMSMLTAVAMASEGEEGDIPPASINLLLTTDSEQKDEVKQDQVLNDDSDEQVPNEIDDGEAADENSDEQNLNEQESGEDSDNDERTPEESDDEQILDKKQPDESQNSEDEKKDDNSIQTSDKDDAEQDAEEDKTSVDENQDTKTETDVIPDTTQQNDDIQTDESNQQTEENSVSNDVIYSDKGQTADGHNWEMTKDATTGKYTLTITFPHSEDEDLNITEDDLKNIEQYAAEVSAALAAKYGSSWEWDSTAVPSGAENINMFQVFLSGDGNTDHTYRYDADKLEQMDGEFTLEKVDENGNLITDSEATFQLWHINEITDPDTSETVEVKMFCSYDAETNTYTFVPTESTIQTINGRIEILYAMMKDVVYYLQEVSAPAGYEIDPDIHIIMEKEVWEQEDESFRDQFSYLGEFTEDENGRIGLDVKFVDVEKGAGDYISDAKPTPIDTPDETPMQVPEVIPDPEPIPEPGPAPIDDFNPVPEEKPEFPENPPVVEVPGDPEPVPAPVNVNDIPATGDILDMFLGIAIFSAIGLFIVTFLNRKKSIQ